MEIKARRTSLGDAGIVRRGDKRTVTDAVGKKLIARGLYEEVTPSRKPKQPTKGAEAPKGE